MIRRPAISILTAAVLLASALASPVGAGDEEPAAGPFYLKSLKAWKQERLKGLTSEDGWLTLVGLYWLEPGENSVGADPSSRVALPEGKAPVRAGSLILEGEKVTARLVSGAGFTLSGKPFAEGELRSDRMGAPDVVRIGTVSFYVVRRGDRFGVRVKDSKSPVRTSFRGLEYFPADSSYRFLARFVRYDPPKDVEITSVLGTTSVEKCPGYAEFELGGKTYRLEPIVEANPLSQLFFIFKDATSGKETYPAGRFLYADAPADDRVVLDFNRAINPPCAFTRFATCPLPPKQNALPVRIEAGEKAYHAE